MWFWQEQAGLWQTLKQQFGFRQCTTRVVIDEDGVTRYLNDDRVERVRWQELAEVSILTTDEGPFVEDVYFLLIGRDGKGCAIPQEDATASDLLARLQQLPGFDNGQVIEAMGCTANNRFVCWRAEATGVGSAKVIPGAGH